ncbi:MAG TPA: cyclic nucleotide-binding protein, partial [Blastocatellia bacterium]|nr:cyclic nucleotide-binding protein [Blastocatellia bacterium]
RLAAEHDYEVNLKAELEVRLLHEKLDEIREQKWKDLVEMQQNQIKMLQQLLESEKVMRK